MPTRKAPVERESLEAGLSAAAFAWAPAGHKISASIAYRLLSPERRGEISRTLRAHPRFAEDFQAKRPEKVPDENFDEWLFQQASIWPDLARRFPEALKDRFHRGPWHYCNRPLFLTDADRKTMTPICPRASSARAPHSPRSDCRPRSRRPPASR